MSRVIVISDKVYADLQKIKKNESFSKAIEALIESSTSKGDIAVIERFFGVLSKENSSAWKKEINRSRKSFGSSRL